MSSDPILYRLGRSWTIARILLVGTLVREAFSFWTGHPFDFESWIRTGYVVAHGGNPYSAFWPPVPGASFESLNSNLTSAAYLPFWPELLAGLYLLWTAVGGGDRFVLYFLLKQPVILADVASAYLLYRLVLRYTGDGARARQVALFWSLFPYAITITAIWGQFDSIIVVLLLALFYARGAIERNLLLGLGIFVKWLTVIYLPLEFFRAKGLARATFLVALALAGGLTLLVFGLEGWSIAGFGTQGLASVALSQSQGGGLGMNYALILSLANVQSVLGQIPYFYRLAPYAWVPGILLGGWAAARWVGRGEPISEMRALLFVLVLFLLLRWGLYEQYFLYLFGLLALAVAVFRPGFRALFRFTWGLAAIDLLVNNDLGMRFVSPIDPGIYAYTAALDANDGYGIVRTYLLVVLAVAVTLTLVQWAWTLWRDDPEPRPWPWSARDAWRRWREARTDARGTAL